MDLFSLDLDTAKNIGAGAIGVSVLGLLLVLKFVKSIVSKILLLTIFGLLAYLSYTQRDELAICAARVEASIASSDTISCTFFGQTITVPSVNS